VVLVDGGLPPLSALPDPALFTTAVVVTAVTGLVAAVLYQRAVSLAPLSLTVPYLAFAPVFVVSDRHACSSPAADSASVCCVCVPAHLQCALPGLTACCC
jgi:hypothetical protein